MGNQPTPRFNIGELLYICAVGTEYYLADCRPIAINWDLELEAFLYDLRIEPGQGEISGTVVSFYETQIADPIPF